MAILRESFEDSYPPSHERDPSFAVEASATQTGSPVIVIHGAVNRVSAPELTDVVAEALEGAPDTLVFDLSDVRFLGLAGIRVIDSAAQTLPEGPRIVLRRPQPRVRRMLVLTHMDDYCAIED